MNEVITLEELIKEGFTFEVNRLPDAPLAPHDQVILADGRSGRTLIARAPISAD